MIDDAQVSTISRSTQGIPMLSHQIMVDAPEHGWTPLYQDRYPYAGGRDHYAGWLENSAGFKAEVVAE